MPYKFRQSQVLAPSRRMVPELAQARDLLRAQLADLSSTGRGLSQSESYRALVVVESLVNEAHHSSPQDLAALGRRIGKILGRAPGQTLSIADAKAIRAAARREYSAAHFPAALCLTPRPPHTTVWLDAQPSSGVTRL
eukprot:COSAG01_NODE_7346_length_3242_cov_5.263124_3_plen_138_part_00